LWFILEFSHFVLLYIVTGGVIVEWRNTKDFEWRGLGLTEVGCRHFLGHTEEDRR